MLIALTRRGAVEEEIKPMGQDAQGENSEGLREIFLKSLELGSKGSYG